MTKSETAQEDAFEEFLVEVDFLLDDLQMLLEQSSRYRDVTVAFDNTTLERIEAFYLDVVSGKEQVSLSEERLNRIVSAFLGEALRHRAGGKWVLEKNKRSSFYNTPVIIEWAPNTMPWSPFFARERLADGKQPFVKEFIEYALNKEEVERKLFE